VQIQFGQVQFGAHGVSFPAVGIPSYRSNQSLIGSHTLHGDSFTPIHFGATMQGPVDERKAAAVAAVVNGSANNQLTDHMAEFVRLTREVALSSDKKAKAAMFSTRHFSITVPESQPWKDGVPVHTYALRTPGHSGEYTTGLTYREPQSGVVIPALKYSMHYASPRETEPAHRLNLSYVFNFIDPQNPEVSFKYQGPDLPNIPNNSRVVSNKTGDRLIQLSAQFIRLLIDNGSLSYLEREAS
jgi:hypothetical protein